MASHPAWPHVFNVAGASVTVYQPQAIRWDDHATLAARAAIAITRAGEATPVLGTIEVSFNTLTDAATNTVSLSDAHLLTSHFPALDTDQSTRLEAQIRQALPDVQLDPVPVRSILLSLGQQAPGAGAAVQNDPPVIPYSDKPASLVVFDGEPVLAPAGQTGLSYAVNTNWDVFHDDKDWYLLNNGLWLAAPAYTGPYMPVARLPAAFSRLPADANFADVRKAIPPQARKPAVVPKIFVSTKPADIIVTEGPPRFVPVPGTALQTVSNTDAELFLQPSSGTFFVLISGRWFAAPGLDGPWSFATDHLPPDFAFIRPDSKQAAVLASVPGTTQAQVAVLQAQVPRQATLNPANAHLTVVYAGAPQFRPIPGTSLTYAVNTSFEVIGTSGQYYACYQGAWFVAASPAGPWTLAANVPQVIYTIPPGSPLYNVTYVRVYAATPTAVTFGYTAGYQMGFVTAGVVVYGTGYYYPPVVIPGIVPVYYPYPYTYAGSVRYYPATGGWVQGGAVYGPYGGVAKGGTYYNPNNGAFARGGAIYGPNGGAGAFSYYNPSTGGYAHGSAAWGPNGGSAHGSYYNPRTGVSGSTNQNWNEYSRWGSSTVSGPNQTVHTASAGNAQGSAGAYRSSTGAEGAGYHGQNGNHGGAVKTQNGDVYAGHDGNVYQHSSTGWSKWNNGGWQPVTPPSSSRSANGSGSQANHPPSAQSQRTGRSERQNTQRQPMDAASFQQLEQDRQARFAGSQRFGQEGRSFGGGQFGDDAGGGRFRR